MGAARADALADLIARGTAHPDPDADSDDGPDGSFLVTIIADADVLAGADSDGTCQIGDGPRLAAETARRLACDAPTVTIREHPDGTILNVGRRTRRIGRRLRPALRYRDRHGRYPGCTRTRTQRHHLTHWAHGQHLTHWAHGGPTNLHNLISLCLRHHHRLHP
jgi:hypothetical protein